MTDLADLQARLDALRAARASGVSDVEFSNGDVRQRVSYKTDAEMAAAIAGIEAEINTVSGARPVRSIVIRNSGGW